MYGVVRCDTGRGRNRNRKTTAKTCKLFLEIVSLFEGLCLSYTYFPHTCHAKPYLPKSSVFNPIHITNDFGRHHHGTNHTPPGTIMIKVKQQFYKILFFINYSTYNVCMYLFYVHILFCCYDFFSLLRTFTLSSSSSN